MTPTERRHLAEAITTNPLYRAVLDEMEAGAIEALVNAQDNEQRHTRQMKVQAIRAFRADLDACLDTREPRSAPA